MIWKRIIARLTRGRLLTPEEMEIYYENKKNTAKLLCDLYAPSLLGDNSDHLGFGSHTKSDPEYKIAQLIAEDFDNIRPYTRDEFFDAPD